MRNVWRRSLSMFLTVVLVLGMLPMNIWAAETTTADYEIENAGKSITETDMVTKLNEKTGQTVVYTAPGSTSVPDVTKVGYKISALDGSWSQNFNAATDPVTKFEHGEIYKVTYYTATNTSTVWYRPNYQYTEYNKTFMYKVYCNVTVTLEEVTDAAGTKIGSISAGVATQKVYQNDAITLAANAVDGYTAEVYFGTEKVAELNNTSGWSTTVTLDSALVAKATDGALAYTVKYVPITYTITWDAGTGAWADSTKTQTTNVACGTVISAPATNPVKSGESFSGWVDENGAALGTSDIMGAGNKTYTATYLPDTINEVKLYSDADLDGTDELVETFYVNVTQGQSINVQGATVLLVDQNGDALDSYSYTEKADDNRLFVEWVKSDDGLTYTSDWTADANNNAVADSKEKVNITISGEGTGTVTVNGTAYSASATDVLYDSVNGTAITVAHTANTDSIHYNINSVTIDGNTPSDKTSFTIIGETVDQISVEFGKDELASTKNESVKFNYHESVGVAGQMDGGDYYADVPNQKQLEEVIVEALGITYNGQVVTWGSDVSVTFNPNLKGALTGNWTYDSAEVALDTDVQNKTALNQVTYYGYDFAESGRQEQVVIRYKNLAVTAKITLTEGRVASTVTYQSAVTEPVVVDSEADIKAQILKGITTNSGNAKSADYIQLSGNIPSDDTVGTMSFTYTDPANTNYLEGSCTGTIQVKGKVAVVNITVNGNGNVTMGHLDASGTLAAGDYTLVATPNGNYYVSEVTINGVAQDVSSLTSYGENRAWSKGGITLEKEVTYNVVVTFAERTLTTATSPSIDYNFYYDVTDRVDEVKQELIDHVLVAEGGTITKDALTVSVYNNTANRYYNIDGSDSEFMANGSFNAASEDLKIVWTGDARYPTMTVDNVTVAVKETRADKLTVTYTGSTIAANKLENVSVTADMLSVTGTNGTVGTVGTPAYKSGTFPTTAGNVVELTYTVKVAENENYVEITTEFKVPVELKTYTVTWDSATDAEDKTTTVGYGIAPVAPTAKPTKAGDAQYTWTFAGWQAPDAADGTAGAVYQIGDTFPVVEGDITYTAVYTYTINKYTISWDIDDDGDVDTTTIAEYGTDPTVDAPTPADKENLSFDHWEPDQNVDSNYKITGAVTYTAKYTNDTVFYVYFMDGDQLVHTATVNDTKGGVTASYAIDDKEYQVFGGWYTDAACTQKYTFGQRLSANLTLYVNWLTDDNNNEVEDTKETGLIQVTVTGNGTVTLSEDFDKTIITDKGQGLYSVLFDSKDAATKVITVTATSNDVDGTDGNITWLSSAPAATVTVVADNTVTVNAGFTTYDMGVADRITAKINLHESQMSAHADNLKNIVLTAAFGEGNYTAEEYEVKVKLGSTYVDVSNKLALGNLLDGDLSDYFQIIKLASGNVPQVSKEVFVQVTDSREKAVITAPAQLEVEFDLASQVLDAVKAEVSAKYGNKDIAVDLVVITTENTISENNDGVPQTITYKLNVAESVDYLAADEKTVVVTATGKVHAAEVTVSNDTAKGSVTGVATGKYDARDNATLSFVVTPKDGYHVESVTVNGTVINGTYAVAVDGEYSNAYSGSFTIENGDYNDPSSYEVVVTYGKRSFTVTDGKEVYFNVNASYASQKARIERAIFDSAVVVDGTHHYNEFVLEPAEVPTANQEYTYTITWLATAKYPAVTKTVKVNLVDERQALENPYKNPVQVVVNAEAEYTDDALLAALEHTDKLPDGAVVKSISYDTAALSSGLKQGEVKTAKITIVIQETDDYMESTWVATLNVTGKIQAPAVVLIQPSEGGRIEIVSQAADNTALNGYTKYVFGLNCVNGYYIDNMTVSYRYGEAINEKETALTNASGELQTKTYTCADGCFTENGQTVMMLRNGSGEELGVVPRYTVSAAFTKLSIKLPTNATMTYYRGMEGDSAQLRHDLAMEALKNAGNGIVFTPAILENLNSNLQYRAAAARSETMTIDLERYDIDAMYLAAIRAALGSTTISIPVEVKELWLDIGEDIPKTHEPTQEEIDQIAQILIEKLESGTLDLDDLEGEVKDALTQVPSLQEYYTYFGAHRFCEDPANPDTETVRLVISQEDNTYYGVEVMSGTCELHMEDTRAVTYIKLNTGVAVTYGQIDETELKNALVEGVYAKTDSGDVRIGGGELVTFTSDVTKLNANEGIELTVEYAGTMKEYQESTATGTVVVNKADVSVAVGNLSLKWQENLSYTLPITTNPAGVQTLDFIVGLDISNVNLDDNKIKGIVGDIQLMIPEDLQEKLDMLAELANGALGTNISFADGASMSISELQSSLDTVGQYVTQMAPEYKAMVDILTNMLNSLPTDVADVKVTIGGKLPTNVGAYLVASVSADNNYNTDFGAGIVVIRPNGIKAEIDWIYKDSNYIFTNTLLQNGTVDLGAYVTGVAAEAGASIEAAEEQLVELFLGVDIDGTITLTSNQKELDVGVYVETAMIVNWGNEFYYSEPIMRPVVVVAESLNVDFLDENGQVNNDRLYEFDNTAKDGMEGNLLVTYKQDGANYKAGDAVTDYNVKYLYTGVQTNGKPYISGTAPVHAGAYAVTAIVTVRDAQNMISHAGVGHAALVIEPTDSSLEITNKVVVHDGAEHGISDMVTATSKVPGLTPDTTIISAGLSADLDTIDGLEDISASVNVDMPKYLDEILNKLDILEAGYTENGIKVATFIGYVEKVKAALVEYGVDTAAFDEIIGIVEQLPQDVTLTFHDDITYSQVGAYLVLGVVTDSDHYPSVGAGIMVIVPDATKVELQFEEDWNGNNIFTWTALENMNLEAQAYDLGGKHNAEASKKVINLYFGFTDNGEFLLCSVAYGEHIKDEPDFDNGVYTQMALLADLGNTMYYAEPISRAFVILPTPASVEFVDETGAVNNDRHFVFNNQPHEMPVRVTVNNTVVENPGEDLTVRYAGVQTNGVVWNSEQAPIHAGTYAVTATYTGEDAQGRLVTLGVAIGVMVIEPTQSNIDVESKTHEYDGNSVDTSELVTAGSTVEGMTPDTTVITAAISTDGTFSENMLGAITSNVNVDFPAWMDEVLMEYAPSIYTSEGIKAGEFADKVLVKLNIAIDDAKILADKYNIPADKLIENLRAAVAEVETIAEQLPKDTVLTFHDQADVAPNAVGTYLIVGIVTDSDHYPSIDAGVLVIYPKVTKAELDWFYKDLNGIITLPALSKIDMTARGYVDGVEDAKTNEMIAYLTVGIDEHGKLIVTTEPNNLTSNGAYTQVAFIPTEIGAEMTYAAPIIRSFLVVAQTVDVQVTDTEVSFGQDYDVSISVTEMNGQQITGERPENLKVTYIGMDASGKPYHSTEKPTQVGVYTVVAAYIQKNAQDDYEFVGMNAGTLTIVPAEPDYALTDKTVVHDTVDSIDGMITNTAALPYAIYIVKNTAAGDVNVILPAGWEVSLEVGAGVDELVNALEKLPAVVENTEIIKAVKAALNSIDLQTLTINGDQPTTAGTYEVTAIAFGSANYRVARDSAVLVITHTPVAVEKLDATCTDAGYEAHYKCSVCGTLFSDADGKNEIAKPVEIPALGHKDENKDHLCDNGCDVAQGTCEDTDKDHACDYGCDKTYGTCEDTDKDHACDYGCDKTYGTCEDADKDHDCDYGCDKTYGTCEDTDKDHACDYGCDKTFGTCEDTDKDHACDYGCDKTFGTCEDADKDHDCDYGCDKTFGECVDADKDHDCDYGCDKTFGECVDADKDHDCDYGCDKTFGECVDADKDHICDYSCGKVFGTCVDSDNDHKCDVCGAIMSNGMYPIVMNPKDSDTVAPGAVIWVDGDPYVLDENCTAWVETTDAKIVTTYRYNSAATIYGSYPTNMYVWYVTLVDADSNGEADRYQVERVAELDDFFKYEGTSIRINFSSNGIRFFTSIPAEESEKLMNGTLLTGSLEGYRMTQTGTLYKKYNAENTNVTLANGVSSYVYGGEAGDTFRVFSKVDGRIWYTGMLTGLGTDAETIDADIMSRPYATLECNGETITLYGGTIQRSIYYVATQNRDYWPEGTVYDNFVEQLITTVDSAKKKSDILG